MRSAGSRGGLPGRNDDAIRMSGESSAGRTFGMDNSRANHRCGVASRSTRLSDTRRPISHAVIGETRSVPFVSWTALIASSASRAIGSFRTSQIAVCVSSRSVSINRSPHLRTVLFVQQVGPLGISGFSEVNARHKPRDVLQSSEYRVTFTFLRRRRRGLGRWFFVRTFGNAAKNQLAGAHVHLRAFITRLEPDFRHHIVGRIIAPPGSMMLCLRRQLHAGDLLDVAEGQRYFTGAVLLQECPEIFIFTHLSNLHPPTYSVTHCV